jgi:hypothetical protein
VDDEAALERKEGAEPLLAAFREKVAGTVIIFRYRSAEQAHQQPLPAGENGLLWGRFLVVVFGLRPGEDKLRAEEGRRRQRSQRLVRAIKEALGA